MSDPFEQIGPKLEAARQVAGLDVAEAARLAQVPRAVAEALEAENFSHFASPVYAKSFLLQYSEYLNVDAKTWLDALEPGAFMINGALLKGPEAPSQEAKVVTDERGGVVAVFALLLLSAAIVVGAIKGYEFFEARLGVEPPVEAPIKDADRNKETKPDALRSPASGAEHRGV